jgi:hypothetical protein
MLIDGLDAEQRKKIDDTLDGADPTTGADRRTAMKSVGMNDAQIEARLSISAASTPEDKAAARVRAVQAAQAAKAAKAAANKHDGGN